MTAAAARHDGRSGTLRLLLANPLAAAGLAVLALVAVVALAAPLLPLPDPAATALGQRLLPPLSPGHPLGTDALGRDLLSRLVWGTRLSLAVALAATLAAALLGSLTGLVAGFAGGAVDGGLMRVVDLLMAFPYILLALAIVAVLGPGLFHALLAIAAVNVPFFARTVRGATLGLARRDFVDAARMGGAGPLALLATEILPNVMPVIVVTASTSFGWMILETAGLSFLGLGAQPPLADLGAMLGEARKVMFIAPHVSLVPGVMVFVIVMAINLAGDGLRDALDPRLRSGVPARRQRYGAIRPRRARRPIRICRCRSRTCAPRSTWAAASCRLWPGSTWSCAPAPGWAWWESPAPASRRPHSPCCAWCPARRGGSLPGRCWSMAATCW